MKTGLVTSDTYQNHNTGEGHPEKIDRVTAVIENFRKLNNKDLNFYVNNFLKSGMKKSLLWYKVMLSRKEKIRIINSNLPRKISIPSIFISGSADWGMYQKPGDLENMESLFLKNYFGRVIIDKAGHWVQQEQPNKTFNAIITFFKKI